MNIEEFFFNQGILGAIVVVLAGVIVYLFRQLQKSQTERICDIKDVLLESSKLHAELRNFMINQKELLKTAIALLREERQ